MKVTQKQKQMIERAQIANTKARKFEDLVFLEFQNLNLVAGHGRSFNSSNTEEAISCHINYGEGSLEEIVALIEACEVKEDDQ